MKVAKELEPKFHVLVLVWRQLKLRGACSTGAQQGVRATRGELISRSGVRAAMSSFARLGIAFGPPHGSIE